MSSLGVYLSLWNTWRMGMTASNEPQWYSLRRGACESTDDTLPRQPGLISEYTFNLHSLDRQDARPTRHLAFTNWHVKCVTADDSSIRYFSENLCIQLTFWCVSFRKEVRVHRSLTRLNSGTHAKFSSKRHRQ